MKVKYLSGKQKDQVVDLDDTRAKSLIEDELAVEVEADALDLALKNLDIRITEAVTKAVEPVATQVLDKVSKSLGAVQPRIMVGPDRELEDPRRGFKSFNHFLFELSRSGCTPTGLSNPTPLMAKHLQIEDRVTKTAGATPYNSEGTINLTAGTNDGAVIPVYYSTEIFKMYGEQDDFMSYCFPFPMNSLSAHLPVMSNYNRANTTAANGVVTVEPGEGQVISNSKTVWEQRIFTLVKESIMVPVSNEALDDNNVGLGSAIAGQAMWQLRKQINGGIIRGFTASCVGIVGNAATKIVGRGANGAISFADLLSMYAAFAHQDASYQTAYWVGHPTVVNSIFNSTIGSFPAMIAPGGGQDSRPLSILGRPLILTGWSRALGTSGDLMLVDFKKYIVGYKGGVQSFVSPHVFATSDQTGFRFTQRVNGQAGLTGLITLEDGSATVSPFVVLGQVGGLS